MHSVAGQHQVLPALSFPPTPVSFTPATLTVEHAFSPKPLVDGQWVNETCTAGAFVDFYVDVDEAHTHDNLFLEVIHDAPDSQRHIRPDSLSFLLYYAEIPHHRRSSQSVTESPDRTYSLAVNAHEIKTGRYFASVQCGAEDASFGVFAEFSHAELFLGGADESHICSNELL